MPEKKRTLRSSKSSGSGAKKPRRLRAATGKIGRPLKKVATSGKREYHPVKLPDNKAGRILSRRVSLVPGFVREAWSEIRQVRWPTRRETIRLAIAVFIFSVVLTVVVAVLDFGLDKIFREIIVR